VHAAWRTAPVRHALLAPAWAEQCLALAVLAVAGVALNALTTGDHLLRTLASGYWPVAGVDLALLATAALAAVAARHLRRRAGAHTRDGGPSMAARPGAAHGCAAVIAAGRAQQARRHGLAGAGNERALAPDPQRRTARAPAALSRRGGIAAFTATVSG